MGRSLEVVLEDGDVVHCLDSNLASCTQVDDMAIYPKCKWRSRGTWSQLYKHRGLLLDLMKLSKGMQLRQKPFEAQVAKFLKLVSINFKSQQAEDLAYRVRMMVKDVIEAKHHGRVPGPRYESMLGVLNYIPEKVL